MRELELSFTGRGQVKGFLFTQIEKNDVAYIYRVDTNGTTHYEIFYRKENTRFNCVSYPSNKGFGVWAWTMRNYESAMIKFNELSEEVSHGI